MNETERPFEDLEIVALPLVIGVTGHRDLREEDRKPLEAQVRRIYAELHRLYPNTPLILLSPLAEGADQLAARVALENGVRLIVPLPMPRTLYEEDFPPGTSRDEFSKLLERAESWFELPLLQSAREEEVRQNGSARDRQYEQVGAYVALHSQILIALWDGRDSDQVGSTAQVVQFELLGVPEPYAPRLRPLDEPEKGAVYQIVTPRVINPAPAGPFTLRKFYPGSSTHDSMYFTEDGGVTWHDSHEGRVDEQQGNERGLYEEMDEEKKKKEEFERALQHLDTFNQDWKDHRPHLIQKQEQNKLALLGAATITALPTDLRRSLDRYANVYAIADALAMHFRDKTVGALSWMFVMAFIAVFFFDIFAHLRDFWSLWVPLSSLIFYLAILGVAFFKYRQATRGHYKDKYLDYRALAEGLRIQFFWRLADVPETVATHYLRKQKSELDWIRNSVRVANLLCDPTALKLSSPAFSVEARDQHYRWILKNWIEQQSAWFTCSAKRDDSRWKYHERWRGRFFTLGLFLAFLLLVLQVLQLIWPKKDFLSTLIDILIVFLSLALVFYALNEGYSDKRAYAEQSRQFQRMSRLFSLASQRFQDALEQGRSPSPEHIILDLGEEALAENGDWVILHRARPINVPIEG